MFNVLIMGYGLVGRAVQILIFNLIIHLILRGLWIGAVGLRYFSGDIDFDTLGYTPKFENYLKKRIGSFDSIIAKLEDYCSVIFSFTFLLIFFLLSFLLLTAPFIVVSVIVTEGEASTLFVVSV